MVDSVREAFKHQANVLIVNLDFVDPDQFENYLTDEISILIFLISSPRDAMARILENGFFHRKARRQFYTLQKG